VPRRQIVLYDGICGLCDRTVQFLLRIDRRRVLTFAALQGSTAVQLLADSGIAQDLRSIIFVRDEGTAKQRIFCRSAAALAILRTVGGLWTLASALAIVPRPLRDAVYDWIARHRYRWWGRLETCRVPTPEEAPRFLA
jgi:predicted DCC family thiol-disulfide oxidoreductase YuxK